MLEINQLSEEKQTSPQTTNNKKENNRKFYVYEDDNINVLKILFEFLKEEYKSNDKNRKPKRKLKQLEHDKNRKPKRNLEQLEQEIEKRIEDNTQNKQIPENYFNTIKKLIEKLKTIISKSSFTELSDEDKQSLAEFLYQLEDLAADTQFAPESARIEDSKHKLSSVITKLNVIKTLTLPILENCSFQYVKPKENEDVSDKTVEINLVKDVNFLATEGSCYKFFNFYPFNDDYMFLDKQEAIEGHYRIMAKNYFNYLQDLLKKDPLIFIVCHKPGVELFANNIKEENKIIKKVFAQEFNKLEPKYKDRIRFCVNKQPIDGSEAEKTFRYDYTLEELRKLYPKNNFLKQTDIKIKYVNGIASDAFVKLGNEGRPRANHRSGDEASTEDLFAIYSNMLYILYNMDKIKGIEISDGKVLGFGTPLPLKGLVASSAEIYMKKSQTIDLSMRCEPIARKIFMQQNVKDSDLQQGINVENIRNYIKRKCKHRSAFFYYTEKERKNNAFVEFGNNNDIMSLSQLNTIIQNIHGNKCSWCCGNY